MKPFQDVHFSIENILRHFSTLCLKINYLYIRLVYSILVHPLLYIIEMIMSRLINVYFIHVVNQ